MGTVCCGPRDGKRKFAVIDEVKCPQGNVLSLKTTPRKRHAKKDKVAFSACSTEVSVADGYYACDKFGEDCDTSICKTCIESSPE